MSTRQIGIAHWPKTYHVVAHITMMSKPKSMSKRIPGSPIGSPSRPLVRTERPCRGACSFPRAAAPRSSRPSGSRAAGVTEGRRRVLSLAEEPDDGGKPQQDRGYPERAVGHGATLLSQAAARYHPATCRPSKSHPDRSEWRSRRTRTRRFSSKGARCLATAPRVVLLDEPLAGLSADGVDVMIAMIRRVRGEGVTVVIIEHTMQALLVRYSPVGQGHHLHLPHRRRRARARQARPTLSRVSVAGPVTTAAAV